MSRFKIYVFVVYIVRKQASLNVDNGNISLYVSLKKMKMNNNQNQF